MRRIHRFILWRYQIPDTYVLNDPACLHPPTGVAGSSPESPAPVPAKLDLHGAKSPVPERPGMTLLAMIKNLKAEAFTADGRQIAYARLRDSAAYRDYQDCTARLRSFNPGQLASVEEQLAFWINLYNALIIDAVIRFDVQKSVQEVPGFFWRAAYDIGGWRFDSADMEYGVLRANRSHPAIPGPHFSAADPRRACSLNRLDPRAHFALVCGARSCPPIGVYDPEVIDSQLELATMAFVNNGGVEIDRDSRSVRMSKIFQWYAPDFGARPLAIGDKRPILEFVIPYLMDPDDRSFLGDALENSWKLKVTFSPYDWGLNIN